MTFEETLVVAHGCWDSARRALRDTSEHQESAENPGPEKKFWTYTKVLTDTRVLQRFILNAEECS